jgi:pSer/pThr/pTyr-binding forkhead associated (FHA) protein
VSDQTHESSVNERVSHARSAAELRDVIRAERVGLPFLVWRDAARVQQIFTLDDCQHATLGRRSSNDIVLSGDSEVSRTHAELELIGEEWTINDDGLSRNGTFVNGERITHRRRLTDRDVVIVGRTLVEFRAPSHGTTVVTSSGSSLPMRHDLTDTQRKILIALCRPYRAADPYATPASNQDIAHEVFLGVDAVKNHLRLLFQRFELADLPQNQKRARLAQHAFQTGLVTDRDF